MSTTPLFAVSSLEALEPRIAPASLSYVNPFTATYTDTDGDHVKVKFTKGILTPANFQQVLVTTPSGSGDQLNMIDLTALESLAKAQGTGIAVTVTPGPTGDGMASVGYIRAGGVDLGAVVISGDLGKIFAGDDNSKTLGVKSLTVKSFGRFGTSTGANTTASSLTGGLGSLTVAGDMIGVTLQTSDATYGKIGSISIGGSLLADSSGAGGTITPAAGIGAIKIGGSIVGGSADDSGEIGADNGSLVGSVFVGGSVLGNAGANSGTLIGTKMGKVVIMGSLVGSGGGNSGQVSAEGSIGAVVIGGDLAGGMASFSGSVSAGGSLGPVVVGGSIIGGGAGSSGSIVANSTLASVTILGSIVGNATDGSAVIHASSIGAVKIAGSVQTGSTASGQIIADGGDIRSIMILGSAKSGNAFSSTPTISASGKIGPIYVGGALTDVEIDAQTAIASLTVGGTVDHSLILASHGGAQIGRVSVGANWIGSSLVAGATNSGGSQSFGDGNDAKVAGGSVISKIASVTIGGYLAGTAATGDHYGFVAEQVGAFEVGGALIPLTPGAHNDDRTFTVAPDVAIHEV